VDYRDVVAKVERLGGLHRHAAERAVDALVMSLSDRYSGLGIDALVRELPSRLDRRVFHVPASPPPALAELYDVVQRRERVERGFAAEHAEVVCRALAKLVSAETLTLLRRDLPAEVFDLFREDAPPRELPPHGQRAPREEVVVRTTLAAGRPGTRHPISESKPDRAHTHSVARSENPHADTKLSSARGTTQERFDETLADGAPGPHRPIATTR